MAKKRDKWVVWPVYFDAHVARSAGRKVAKANSWQNPKVDEIVWAARKLGLNLVAEEGASYPGRWWLKEGRVLIDKQESKRELLDKISSYIIQSKFNK
jgi:signal recognition particle subunit SRP19